MKPGLRKGLLWGSFFAFIFWCSLICSVNACAQLPTGWNNVTLSSDQTSSSTSLADCTGLTFPVVAGTYLVKGTLFYTSDVSTTGINVSINTGATTTDVSFSVNIGTTSNAVSIRNIDSLDGGSTAATGAGAASQYPVLISSYIIVTTSGTFAVRYASEIGGSDVTILLGSYIEYQKIL